MVENNENVCFILRVFASELAAATLWLQMCNPRPSSHFPVENLYWLLSAHIYRHISSILRKWAVYYLPDGRVLKSGLATGNYYFSFV